MKNLFRLSVFVFFGIFCFCVNSYADISNEIAFQGRLTDTAGNPINGARSFTFTIYNSSNGSIYTKAETIDVKNGLYNTIFTLNDSEISQFSDTLSIEVKVGGVIIGDRTKLTSSPYALTVKDGAITPSKMNTSVPFGISVASASYATTAENIISGGGLSVAHASTANIAGMAYAYSSTAPINTSGAIAAGSLTASIINATNLLNVGTSASSATFSYNGTSLFMNRSINIPNGAYFRIGAGMTAAELSYDTAINGISVSSHAKINGNLTVTGIINAGSIPIPSSLSLNTLTVTSTSTFNGLITTSTTGIKVGNGFGANGTFSWNNNAVNLQGSLHVSSLTVTSTSTFGGLITTSNTGIKVGNGVGTNGTFSWNNNAVNLQGNLNVTGNITGAIPTPSALSLNTLAVNSTSTFGGLITTPNIMVNSTSTFNGLITTSNTGIKVGNAATTNGTFSWNGNAVNLQGDLNVTGTIYASTAVYSGADLAEIYPSADVLEPGDTVIISETRDGYIEKSKTANDTKVAGVISTEPGIVLNSGEKGYKLALVGKVPVKVTNEGGNIKRGDLLVASSTPGHAMKASDPKPGTVIGKALENSTGSRGKILALVNLQ